MTRALRNQASLLVMGKTYAPFRVWKGSTTEQRIRTQPLTRREAARIYHQAWDFERQTRGFTESRYRKGLISRREGKLGQGSLAVLRAMLFCFLNHRTGRLDPSYANIARKACVSIATVGRALARLRSAGVLNWIPRCRAEEGPEGGFLMRQISNLYALLPASSWRGFRQAPEAPPPDPQTWGKSPPMSAASAREQGGGGGLQTFLEFDSELGRAAARLRPPKNP